MLASPLERRDLAGGSSSDRRNRPPVQAIILVLEAGDLGVRDGSRQEGEKVQVVEHGSVALSGRRPCCRKPWHAGLYRPKHGCSRLVGIPHGTVPRTQQLHLIEVGLELRAVQARRSLCFVVIVEPNHKRIYRAPLSQDRLHGEWRGQLIEPGPSISLVSAFSVDPSAARNSSNFSAHSQPKLHAIGLWRSFGNARQCGFVCGVDRTGLRRREAS